MKLSKAPKAPQVTCACCNQLRPQDSFLLEFNPPGSYFTCRRCLGEGKIYCPVHQKPHAADLLRDFRFSIGKAPCPLVLPEGFFWPDSDVRDSVSDLESSPPSVPVASAPVEAPPATDITTQAILTLADRMRELAELNLEVLALVKGTNTISNSETSKDIERLQKENAKLVEELEKSKQNEEVALALATSNEEQASKLRMELEAVQATFSELAQTRTESVKQLQDLITSFPPFRK